MPTVSRGSFGVASILLLFCARLAASDIELTVGKSQDGVLRDGRSQSYSVTVQAGDFIELSVEPRGNELSIITYDPDGARFRAALIGPDSGTFTFIADHSGKYRVEVAMIAKAVVVDYTITLAKTVTLAARLVSSNHVDRSPRIKALRASLQEGNERSVEAFWGEIAAAGSPIIEPLSGDKKNMLVTFLWRGTPDTHNVIVLRLPYAVAVPEDYFMDHLAGTDVWYKSVVIESEMRFDYTIATNVPPLEGLAHGIDGDTVAMIAAAARPDPLNQKHWRVEPRSIDASEFRGSSVVEMPDAPTQPWLRTRPEVTPGQIQRERLHSKLLKNDREIAVYLPRDYSNTAEPYPFIVLFDEGAYLGDESQSDLVPTPVIADNLISEKRIPPAVILFVGNAPGARRQELACNQIFTEFLVSELLPWAHHLYNLTSNPGQVVVGGSSFGGLAATYAGLAHPERFGNVLAQSGSFWWTPAENENTSGLQKSEPNWMASQFILSPKLDLRFYLDAGREEIDFTGGGNSILLTTRNLRDVLLAKGYDVYFQEFAGGHDYLSWRATLADGLIFLMGNLH